ncbi:MAG: hypothetical protein A2288_03845 [Candidatus Moranbacteria bacterium RIFOXYA12_FULL_44_15]|nr:MAG: hypothetical protein A2288_03845 [Candidatus Moranbacteria bacterium RIFOXYA12_FULL_44_15]OGI35170.1 MAG: hypothetical protein A2259_02260 [Candidatus Moranbacteria bacterium RIFOXYA2_FULL_43_15]
MPKLPVLKSKQLLKILLKAGFEIDHSTGSHSILYRDADGKRAVVPYHAKDLPKGTLQAILKSAGIERKDIGKYL